MKDKEMIEEMAQIMCENNCEECRRECVEVCGNSFDEDAQCVFTVGAEKLYEQGYRKLPEDSVVLTGLELADYKHYKEYTKSIAMVEKETAEKIKDFIFYMRKNLSLKK